MLSHIYRLVEGFEREHGIMPNLLYLNHAHTQQLRMAFDDDYSMERILEILDMEMVLDADILHPHVAWTHTATRTAANFI